MIPYNKIREVNFEISTRCNSTCPDCPRNFRGVNNVIDTYPIVDMSLAQVKQIFTVDFVKQLKVISISGDYGDFVTARDGLEIVRYFKQTNPRLYIDINTNGSARPDIWEPLGKLGITVVFRLDGLADTHHLYRQGTDFNFILENAQKFIAAGGNAIWSYIVFDHNKHQIEEARALSVKLGFKQFTEIRAGRDTMPVFTNDRRLSHIIGNYTGSTDFDQLFDSFNIYKANPSAILMQEQKSYQIKCMAKGGSIYVCANGEVYPCCFLGFYPLLSHARPSNVQLQPLIKNNNALEYGIEEAIKWFSEIEKTWSIDTVQNGKIYECNRTCGIK